MTHGSLFSGIGGFDLAADQMGWQNKFHCEINPFGQFDKKILPSKGWKKFPTESPICGGNDGVSPELDGITFPKWRRQSIAGFGNAIVPPLVLQIFKSIEEYELNL